MAETLRDRLRDLENEKNRWFRERNEQVARLKQDVEVAGREAWNAATRAGVNLLARTPQELQYLSSRVLDTAKRGNSNKQQRVGPAKNAGGSGPSPSQAPIAPPKPARVRSPRDLPEAVMQADAAVRGAANMLTFGGMDHLAAGLDALIQPGGLDGWRQRYDANMALETARNHYDASNRALALRAGQVGGVASGLGLIGPMQGALAAAPRILGAAALSGREAMALAGAGAGMGLGIQMSSDLLAGGRRSSWGDNLGAAVGGAAGAAAFPLGPARAGAVGASVTSVSQDLFNRRPISLERGGKSALAGNFVGGLAGVGGRAVSNALPTAAKGRLGETLGDVRSRVNFQPREWKPKSRDPLLEGYWYPDGRSGRVRFEDKFGIGVELTPNQLRAQAELGPDFQLYHFTPADIGSLIGAPAAATAPHLVERQQQR
ncbi:MAG: hypothetical protein Q8M88_05765 [Phenylobacterium sp.]|uniref:hypothetical protein n=1 Tax=Phenylobacterium sp. TaxID=1871053 RepID=UPI0027349594|nr:hypothetical protein [Phenylobacterium sp.]MDP3173923.1 hypothetical protein [Phenylobacterium sp.]